MVWYYEMVLKLKVECELRMVTLERTLMKWVEEKYMRILFITEDVLFQLSWIVDVD